jgi:hypothetical protein
VNVVVTVTDDGARQAVKSNDLREESACHRRRRVGVAEGNKVRVLGEPVHHGENHRFAAHLGQGFNKIHGDIRPHYGRHLERLEQAGRMKLLGLVALACGVGTHEILHDAAGTGDKERLPESKRFLDALMPGAVDGEQHIWKARRGAREVATTTVSDQLIDDRPGVTMDVVLDLLSERDQSRVGRQLGMQVF